MAWTHNPKPARGGHVDKPASGIPAGGEGQGPKKGAKPAFSDTHQPSGEEKSAGKAVAAEIRERIAAKRHELVDRLLTLSEHAENEQVRLAATNAALDRLVGKPAQSVDLTSGGDKLPGYVMTAPAEIEDAQAWATRHKPKAP